MIRQLCQLRKLTLENAKVSPHQPSISKDWKQLYGLKLTSMSLFLEFVDHK